MGILENRIDFAGIINAINCNPNGDPLNGNLPREDFDGHGLISDVCLKRKIRDRLQEAEYKIFVQRNDISSDGFYSLASRAKADAELCELSKKKDAEKYRKLACKKWIDVRSFGQVFSFKGEDHVSLGVRGAVSIGFAESIDVIMPRHLAITKSTNVNDDEKDYIKKDSATMGVKKIIDKGTYVFFGGIYPQLAEKTGFTEKDSKAIKKAIINMFQNDATSARPIGSMTMEKVFWWQHNSKVGQYSPAKVQRTLKPA